ncbi:unnamed protein product, partial [Polarella glacialis]
MSVNGLLLALLSVRAHGDVACWSSSQYSFESCCDQSLGPSGDASCWDNDFTFEACCSQEAHCDYIASRNLLQFTVSMERDFSPRIRPGLCHAIGFNVASVSAHISVKGTSVQSNYLECLPRECQTADAILAAAKTKLRVRQTMLTPEVFEIQSVHIISEQLKESRDVHFNWGSLARAAFVALPLAWLSGGESALEELLFPRSDGIFLASVVRVLLTSYSVFGHTVLMMEWDPNPVMFMQHAMGQPWWTRAAIDVSIVNVGFAILAAYLAAAGRRAGLSHLVGRGCVNWAQIARSLRKDSRWLTKGLQLESYSGPAVHSQLCGADFPVAYEDEGHLMSCFGGGEALFIPALVAYAHPAVWECLSEYACQKRYSGDDFPGGDGVKRTDSAPALVSMQIGPVKAIAQSLCDAVFRPTLVPTRVQKHFNKKDPDKLRLGGWFISYENGKSAVSVKHAVKCLSVCMWEVSPQREPGSKQEPDGSSCLWSTNNYQLWEAAVNRRKEGRLSEEEEVPRLDKRRGAVLLHFCVCDFASFWRKRWTQLGYLSASDQFRVRASSG